MAKLLNRRRYFDLRGEAQINPDGSSRQTELLQCEPGEQVTLRREPENAFDVNAIAVDSANAICIGYLPKEDAAELATHLDAGRRYEARLHELRGGLGSSPRYGARVEIARDGGSCGECKPLDAAQIRARAGKIAISRRQRDSSGRLVTQQRTGCSSIALGIVGAAAVTPLAYIWF
jgi:hypothetical protein